MTWGGSQTHSIPPSPSSHQPSPPPPPPHLTLPSSLSAFQAPSTEAPRLSRQLPQPSPAKQNLPRKEHPRSPQQVCLPHPLAPPLAPQPLEPGRSCDGGVVQECHQHGPLLAHQLPPRASLELRDEPVPPWVPEGIRRRLDKHDSDDVREGLGHYVAGFQGLPLLPPFRHACTFSPDSLSPLVQPPSTLPVTLGTPIGVLGGLGSLPSETSDA